MNEHQRIGEAVEPACGRCKHFRRFEREGRGRPRSSTTGRCLQLSMPGVLMVMFENMSCKSFEERK